MSRVELARYRMEKAEEFLEDAEDALERRRLMLAVNRCPQIPPLSFAVQPSQ